MQGQLQGQQVASYQCRQENLRCSRIAHKRQSTQFIVRHENAKISQSKLQIQCNSLQADKSASVSSGSVSEPNYNVVITGSSKGVGRALAERFLQEGDTVLVCARNKENVDAAVKELREQYGQDKVFGTSCNVGDANDVQALGKYAVDKLGEIDIWINNAGSNGYKYDTLLNFEDKDIVNIVQTNMLGVLLCCRAAIDIMRKQSRAGHVFNMDGAGANGQPTPRFAAYGATKRGLEQLGKSLSAELNMQKIRNIGIHSLSPGMVTTDLLMAGADTKVAKFFINCLAERPETVADDLVPRVREVPQSSLSLSGGVSQGKYIRFLTMAKAVPYMAGRFFFGIRKSRWIQED